MASDEIPAVSESGVDRAAAETRFTIRLMSGEVHEVPYATKKSEGLLVLHDLSRPRIETFYPWHRIEWIVERTTEGFYD